MGKRTWTDEQFEELKQLYRDGKTCEQIAEILNRKPSAVHSKLSTWNATEKPIRKNNTNFKAIYQNYDWCFDHYINRGMNYQEMASECGASPRVIQKWCSEKHRLNEFTFKENKKLSDQQYMLILAGTLGDGHIDKRESLPIYIESHAENEKDYLFWKYSILKDCCASSPREIEAQEKEINGKKYFCQKEYRFQTRAINQLKEIRSMNKNTKIDLLDQFGLSLFFLDDGSRSSLWQLCVASFSEEEKKNFLLFCERFRIIGRIENDDRYIRFDAESSRRIDQMILLNVPNELDIIKKKILENKKIPEASNPIWVVTKSGKFGLGGFCKRNHIDYKKAKNIITELGLKEIPENQLRDEVKRKYA